MQAKSPEIRLFDTTRLQLQAFVHQYMQINIDRHD